MESVFPKESRLRTRSDFKRVFAKGERVHTRRFILYVLKNQGPSARLGITVSKKVGNAVIRNRIKRCVRDAFRNHSWFKTPTDLVVIAKHGRPQPVLDGTARRVRSYAAPSIANEIHSGLQKLEKNHS